MKKIEKESLSPIQHERLKRGPYFLRKKLRNIERLSFEDELLLYKQSSCFKDIPEYKYDDFLNNMYTKLVYDIDIKDILKMMFKHKISINIKNL